MIGYLVSLSVLFSSNLLNANVIFPSWFMYYAKSNYLSIALVLLALVVEYLVLKWYMPHEKALKIALAVGAMNFVSAACGLVLNMAGDAGFYMLIWGNQSLGWLYPIWFVIFTTVINTIIEYIVALFFFEKANKKKLFFFVFAMNLCSVTFSLLASLLYQHIYGPIVLKLR